MSCLFLDIVTALCCAVLREELQAALRTWEEGLGGRKVVRHMPPRVPRRVKALELCGAQLVPAAGRARCLGARRAIAAQLLHAQLSQSIWQLASRKRCEQLRPACWKYLLHQATFCKQATTQGSQLRTQTRDAVAAS